MGRWFSAATVAAAICVAPGAQAADAASGKLGTVTLSRVVQKLPAGKTWITYQEGALCVTKSRIPGDGVQQTMSMNAFGPVFMRALAGAGRLDNDDRPNLFAEPTEARRTVAYEVGALIHDLDIKLCGLSWGATNLGIKGKATIGVQWQIYSPATRAVVATVETTGSIEAGRRLEGSIEEVAESAMLAVFLESAKQLVVSSQFKTLMDAPPPKDELQSTPGQQAKLSAPSSATPRSVGDSIGSVVLVALPDGHGSGVLVSSDGYVLTNAHVVGLNKTVKVRWSDGFETEGQVVRVHKARDVALVKTDPHGRTPLPTRFGQMQPGEAVLAIGAPLDEQLQGTVSRGIVSANRIMDGYSFIQSDVMVNHGNSGGALIDDKGFLVGLTDVGRVSADGSPVGLNFFIPIKDALDFLSLELSGPGATSVATTTAASGQPPRR